LTDILVRYVRFAERFNRGVGRWLAWATLATVLVCATVVVLRYGLRFGRIWLQDLYVWLHASVFMAGAGYAYLVGAHVRVDILYSRLSMRRKALVDLFGVVVFLLPWLAVLFWASAPFVIGSWQIFEPSAQPGGLPAVYLLKSMLIVLCVVVLIEGAAVAARSLLVLSGRGSSPGDPGESTVTGP
jgi:TRAP-type mannitol/chloroaromatic compound transport system permease small subunit